MDDVVLPAVLFPGWRPVNGLGVCFDVGELPGLEVIFQMALQLIPLWEDFSFRFNDVDK